MLQCLKSSKNDSSAATAVSASELTQSNAFDLRQSTHWSDHVRGLIALMLAVGAHAALFYALMVPSNDLVGNGGTRRDAISITLVDSRVLESRMSKSMTGGGANVPISAAGSAGDKIASQSISSSSPSTAATRPPARPTDIQAHKITKDQDLEKALPTKTGVLTSRRNEIVAPPSDLELPANTATTNSKTANPVAPAVLPVITSRALSTSLRPEVSKVSKSDLIKLKPSIEKQNDATHNTMQLSQQNHNSTDAVTAKPERSNTKKQSAKRYRNAQPDKTSFIVAQAVSAVASATARMGGVSSRSAVSAEQILAAPAAASPGEKNRFALLIGKALRRGIPVIRYRKGINRKLIVLFALKNDGDIRYVRITKSSGKKRLDRSVVAAFKNIDFPMPPADMTPKELTYTLPFYFN